jgi:hypothetical protein
VDGNLLSTKISGTTTQGLAAKYAQEDPQYIPSLLILVHYVFQTVLAQILFRAGSFVAHIAAKYTAEYYCVIYTLLKWTEQTALRTNPLISKYEYLFTLSYDFVEISDYIVANCTKMGE